MSISGEWTLNYSWGCTGEYSEERRRFNDDGTWLNPATGAEFDRGTWMLSGGKIVMRHWEGASVFFGDVVNENMMQGIYILRDVEGIGCWYALPRSSSTKPVAERPQEYDLAGRRRGSSA